MHCRGRGGRMDGAAEDTLRFPWKDLVSGARGLGGDDESEDGEKEDQCLNLKQQMALLGNAMHPVQVGAWVMYNIW